MALAAGAALAALQLGGGEAGGLDAVWRALVVLQAAPPPPSPVLTGHASSLLPY